MTKSWINPEVAAVLDTMGNRRALSAGRYGYYHADNARFFQRRIQKTSRVLIIGCDVEPLVANIHAAEKRVVDLRHVTEDLSAILKATAFDYVPLPYTLHFLENIQEFLEVLRTGLAPEARIVALQYSFLWAPVYKTAEWLGIKASMPSLNWLSPQDLQNLVELAGFEPVQHGTRFLAPFRMLGLAHVINTYFATLPVITNLGHKSFMVARPRRVSSESAQAPTVSIVVPARNEAGNIGALLDRLPVMGQRPEILFIEGHSSDQTWAEIQRQIQTHPRRDLFVLKAARQPGNGKADAVRLGFSQAGGDILFILDADLSVQPEDLPLFYHAITQGTADFLNGSRLVYNMESQAMQILNLFFNKVFGLWISWLIGQPVKDTLCGTKVLFRKDYLRMQAAFAHWSGRDPFGDFDLLFGAARLGLKIRDVPVAYKQRTYGNTNIRRFRHGWQLLKMCIIFWPEFKM